MIISSSMGAMSHTRILRSDLKCAHLPVRLGRGGKQDSQEFPLVITSASPQIPTVLVTSSQFKPAIRTMCENDLI